MKKTIAKIRRNQNAIAVAAVTIPVIVWQHKCIMEALEIINEAGLQDKIK